MNLPDMQSPRLSYATAFQIISIITLLVICMFAMMFQQQQAQYARGCIIGFGQSQDGVYMWRQELTAELKSTEGSCLRVCHLLNGSNFSEIVLPPVKNY